MILVSSRCPLFFVGTAAMSATSTYDEFLWCQWSCAYRSFSKLKIGVSAYVPCSFGRRTRTRLRNGDGAHNNSSGKKDDCEEQFHVRCLLCLSGVQYLLESKRGYSQCLGGGLGPGGWCLRSEFPAFIASCPTLYRIKVG
jgi:hypothetical protein